MSNDQSRITPQAGRPLLNRSNLNLNTDQNHRDDNDDNDDIQILSGTPIITSPIRRSNNSSGGLAQRLQNQHRDQQRRLRREIDMARGNSGRNNTTSSNFYSNPNIHIQDDGPILITSDTEDMDSFHSDSGIVDPNSDIYNMTLSADQRSIRNSMRAQREHLQNLNNHNNSNHGNNGDLDDDVEFVGERELPDIQILPPPPSAGFELYTPSGPLFTPVDSPDEVRRSGIRRTTSPPASYNTSLINSIARTIRNNQSTLRQSRFRRQQDESNRRARQAGNGTVADRVRRRQQRNSVRRDGESSTVRPRNHPSLVLEGIRAYSNMFRFLQSIRFNENFEDGSYMETSNEDNVPENIMRILQSRDEERENERIRNRNSIATTERKKMAKNSRVENSLKKKFSNDLGEENHNDVCVLCGTTFLQGIPTNYNEIPDDNAEKEKEVKDLLKEGFRSPWRSWEKFTNIEIDLSKKVFFSSCGHMYCGRCVNNIMRFRGLSIKQRKDELKKVKNGNSDRINASQMDFENPGFSAPLKCVADGCNKRFCGKTPFNELYV